METFETFKKCRIFPNPRVENPQRAVLSVMDSSSARFSPASAVWLYSAHPDFLTFDRLNQSLIRTLWNYPQFCGQLEWADKPLGKLAIRWGHPTDPGVTLAYARTTSTMASEFLNYADRVKRRHWAPGRTERLSSADDEPLAIYSDILGDWKGQPCCIVQITKFSCGGFAIALQVAHVLADAQVLSNFMYLWSLYNRDINATPSYDILPVFAPELVGEHGKMAGENSDQIVSALPMQEWDLWSQDTSNAPDVMMEHLIPPEHCLPLKKPPGRPVPWITNSVDDNFTCEARYLHFEAAQIKSYWLEASQNAPSERTISKLDALFAKVWNSVIKSKKETAFKLAAHQQSSEDVQFHIGFTINARQRFSPPLHPASIGSPTALCSLTRSINDDFSSVSDTAQLLRSSLAMYNDAACKALVKEMENYDSPQRYWRCYTNTTCSILTSWVRQGAYDNQFVPGVAPYFVEPGMPLVNGMIQITESGPVIDPYTRQPVTPSTNVTDWSAAGATVYLSLEKKALKYVLQDLGFSSSK